jgi:hypothetical protein
MRPMRLIAFVLALAPPAIGNAEPPADQRSGAEKKEQAEKKGALKERVDPAQDLKAQRENVKKLRHNAAENRKIGNRIGAWAADRDAKHAEKLIAKDEALLQKGQQKKSVDAQKVEK